MRVCSQPGKLSCQVSDGFQPSLTSRLRNRSSLMLPSGPEPPGRASSSAVFGFGCLITTFGPITTGPRVPISTVAPLGDASGTAASPAAVGAGAGDGVVAGTGAGAAAGTGAAASGAWVGSLDDDVAFPTT